MKILERNFNNKTYTVEMSFDEMIKILQAIGTPAESKAPNKSDVVIIDRLFRNQEQLSELAKNNLLLKTELDKIKNKKEKI